MNVSVTVGLGHGTRSQKVIGINQIMEKQALLVHLQGNSLNGPFVTAEHVGNSLEEFSNAQGYRDASMFFNVDTDDLQARQPQDKGPDPAMLLAQAEQTKAQAELINAQTKQQALRLELAKIQAKSQSDQADREAEFVTDAMGRTEDQRQHDEDLAFKYTELAAKTGTEQAKILNDARKAEAAMAADVFRNIGYTGNGQG